MAVRRAARRAGRRRGPGACRARYLVTGGTGLLGQHLVDELVTSGHRVRVLARTAEGSARGRRRRRGREHDLIEVVQGSVTDREAVDQALEGMEGVFHLAGVVEHSRKDAAALHAVNVGGTLTVLAAAAAAGVRRVVYASTSGCVGVSKGPDFVADDASPYATELVRTWPYYASKVEAERAALELAEREGLELVVMRPTLLLGPGDYRLSSCRSVYDALQRKTPIIPTGGLSFVDVRDAAAAFVRAMAAGRPGRTYLLGAANMSLLRYFTLIEELSGVRRPGIRMVPWLNWAVRLATRVLQRVLAAFGAWLPSLDPVLVEMSQHFWYVDPAAAKAELGFEPRPAAETVRDTITWMTAYMLKPKWAAEEETVDAQVSAGVEN